MTATVPAERHQAGLTGARRTVDTVFAVLVVAFVAAVVVQIYLAGAGAFGDHQRGAPDVHHAFEPHEALGHYLGMASALLLILALIARPDRGTVIGAVFLLLTTELAQEALADVGKHHRWIGGLHAADALVILVLSTWLAVTAYRRRLAR